MAIIMGDPYTPPAGTFNLNSSTSSFTAQNVGGWAGLFGVLASAWGSRISAKTEKQNLKFQGDMSRLNANYTRQQTLLGASYSEAMSRLQADAARATGEFNAKVAEMGAQSALGQGEKAVASQTLKAGMLKSSQRAAMAANGIDLGEGNAAEVLASTEIMKEIDKNQITENAIRNAWGYRTQGLSAQIDANTQAVNIEIRGMNEAQSIRTQGAQDLFRQQANANSNYVASNAISPDNQFATTMVSGLNNVADSWYRWNKVRQ